MADVCSHCVSGGGDVFVAGSCRNEQDVRTSIRMRNISTTTLLQRANMTLNHAAPITNVWYRGNKMSFVRPVLE